MDANSGDGVQLSKYVPSSFMISIQYADIVFSIQISNWTGTCADGDQRGPVKVMCADGAPCTGIDITDFAIWTESGDSQWYSCESAYTSLDEAPFCLQKGSSGDAYSATTATVTTAPTGYSAPTMPDDLKTAFGTTASIPIPTFPASFYPNVAPYSTIAANA